MLEFFSILLGVMGAFTIAEYRETKKQNANTINNLGYEIYNGLSKIYQMQNVMLREIEQYVVSNRIILKIEE